MFNATLTIALKANGQTVAIAVPTLATDAESVAQAVNVAAAGLLADTQCRELLGLRGVVHARTRLDAARRELGNGPATDPQLDRIESLEADLDAASIRFALARGVLDEAEAETGLKAVEARRRRSA